MNTKLKFLLQIFYILKFSSYTYNLKHFRLAQVRPYQLYVVQTLDSTVRWFKLFIDKVIFIESFIQSFVAQVGR